MNVQAWLPPATGAILVVCQLCVVGGLMSLRLSPASPPPPSSVSPSVFCSPRCHRLKLPISMPLCSDDTG